MHRWFRLSDRLGDRVLLGLCVAAGLLSLAALFEIGYQVINGASPAISRFGVGFLGHSVWKPNTGDFGAATMLFGTAVTSAIALSLATPLGIAIAIYLSMLAPARVRAVVGPMVEMLAAIPSVILGLWGVIVVAPFVQRHIEPALHSVLGFIPIFGSPQTTGLSLFTGGLVLTIMILPIIASLSRDLFLTVPKELKDAAEALGATRWEVIRGVVLPTTASGVASATLLGLSRALGEAIAVASVIGGGNLINSSVFASGSTLAGKIAIDSQFIVSKLHQQSLFFLAALLLLITTITNLMARLIARRFDVHRALT
jgi:phosphate transport system permease protein